MAAKQKHEVRFPYFGQRLKFYREQRGMDQLALGILSGFRSGSAITQMEQGTYNPPLDKILKIAAVLQIKAGWLIDEEQREAPTILDVRDVPVSFTPVLAELIHTIRQECR